MKYCTKCGNAVSDDAAFCGACGTALSQQTEPVRWEFSQTAPNANTVIEAPNRTAWPEADTREPTVIPSAEPSQQQSSQPLQAKKKRGAGPVIAGVIALVVIVALLGVALSRSGSPSSSAARASDAATSFTASQQPLDADELMQSYVGTWKLANVSGMFWISGESDADDLRTYGIEVFLTLSEDGAAQLNVNGESVPATWKVKSKGTAAISFEGNSGSEEGVLSDDWLTFDAGYCALAFVRASAEEASKTEGAGSSGESPIAIGSIYDLAELDTFFTEQPTPANGEVLFDDGQWKSSEITVTAPTIAPCYVKLKDTAGNDVMTWWVDAGQTATVSVPSITGKIVYATGSTWYGVDDLFGPETIYRRPDEVLDLYTYTYELTFQKVPNGNLSTDDIEADEF